MAFNPKALISRNFEIELKQEMTEEELVEVLANRIAEMLDHEPDLLMSTLYRLDVFESKILAVFDNPAIPNAQGLALLILDRQKEKLETRKKYGGGSEEL